MTVLDQETERLQAVARYSILDTPPDGAFNRIAALAARWFDVPIATVTIVDSDRIWFKATHGLEGVVQVGRDLGLCASAIMQDGPYHVEDALTDPRTADNALVHGGGGVRFYAGAPLMTPDGHRLGTVNVLDVVPREVTEDEMSVLSDLAAIVMDELELRLSALTTLRHEREQRQQVSEFATTLQRTLLPPALPEIPGLELACHFHAASSRGVGGDFYDVFFVAPGRWAFFLGDVQGHGVEAAIVTSHIRYTLRAAALHHDDPAEILAELNRSLLHEPTVDRFCTVVFGLLERDVEGWRVTIGTGGHLPALWIRPAEGTVTSSRPPGGMLVGAVMDATFNQMVMNLRDGETLMFYTDGLTENRGAGGRLGEQGLVDRLEGRLPSSARAAVETVEGMIAGMSPSDDVAVLAFSPRETTAAEGRADVPGI